MTWGPFLYVLFLLVFFCVVIPAAVAAYWFWTNRGGRGSAPIMRRVAIAFGSLAFAYLCHLIAVAFGFVGPKPVYTVGYAISFWIGQAILAYALIELVKFLQGGDQDRE